jgi:hypothetical protein
MARSLRRAPGSREGSWTSLERRWFVAPVTILLWWYRLPPMPRGSPAVKLAITVDRDVHAKILSAVEAEGSSISAWITAAARQALRVREGLAAVAEWEAEHGALTEEELEAARQRLNQSSVRPKRRARKRGAP